MRRAIAAATVFLLGVGVSTTFAQEVAKDSMPGLEAEYTMQVGDYAAVLLPESCESDRTWPTQWS